MERKPLITPRSKVLQVIDDYPHLEDVLIRYVPAFKSLKNPLLRKTVARVATLQQAAAIGQVKVEELVNHLRRETGQDAWTGDAGHAYDTEKPGWFDQARVTRGLDAREMLHRGEQPVSQVMADLNALETGNIYRLDAPFLPAPLIDKAISLGVAHWLVQEAEDHYVIFFYRVPAG
jgi:hypothetical protein